MSIYHNQTNVAPGSLFPANSNFLAGISTPSLVGISSINGVSYTGGGGGGSNFPLGATIGTLNQGGFVFGLSSMTANYNTPNNPSPYLPVRLNYNPASASISDEVGMLITYNPDNAGQTALFLGARGTGEAVVGALWEGYITMPLKMYGATMTMESDNETFFFCDGNAGAIGTISTGVQMLSAQNIFSTITDPSKQYQADMTALLSTLKDQYPACFS